MKQYLTIEETSKYLGVSKKSLRTWDEHGKLCSIRTPGGHRRYALTKLDNFLGKESTKSIQKSIAIYCRVSSHDQKLTGDLERQKLRLLEYCVSKSYKVDYILEEVGSGMSSKRSKLNQLFELSTKQQISMIIIEHRDRLTRFMFDSFKQFFHCFNVKIDVVEEKLQESYESELAKDIISIMASFTGKIHGKRSAKNRDKNV